MSKKFSFNNEYIGSIIDINKDKEYFLKKVKLFIETLNSTSNCKIVKRLVDLIKYTDIYFDDCGIIQNSEYRNILTEIKEKMTNDGIISCIENFEREFNILIAIREKWDIKELLGNSEYNYKLIQAISNRLKKNIERKELKEIAKSLRDDIYLVSKSIHRLVKQNKLNPVRLNFSSTDNYNFPKLDEYIYMFQLWKYADAKIDEDGNRIFINGVNDVSRSFVITRNLNQENRRLSADLQKNVQKERVYGELRGVSEEYFKGYPVFRNSEDILVNCGKLHNINLTKWIKFLNYLINLCKKNFLTSNKLFLKINENQLGKDQLKMLVYLRFSIDLLDKPVIHIKNKDYLYIPLGIVMDPVHILSEMLKKEWQNNRGHNFEKEIRRILNGKYKKNDFNIKFKNGREIDALIEDDQKRPLFIECKSFSDPFSFKEYRIQIDKMYSSKYLEHASKNYLYIKKILCSKGNHENLKNKYYNSQDTYGLFIANIIFPQKYRDVWRKKYGINFMHWFEFYRLIRKKPLDADYGWKFSPNIRKFHLVCISHIADSVSTHYLCKQSVLKISELHPLEQLMMNREKVENRIIKKEIQLPDNISLAYFV